MWNEIRQWKTGLVRKFEYEKPRSAPMLTEIGDDRGNFEILTEFLKMGITDFVPMLKALVDTVQNAIQLCQSLPEQDEESLIK